MRVELNQVKFRAYHGLYEHERINGGDFLVDVSLELADLPAYTELAHVANYEEVYAILKNRMNTPLLFIEEVARLIKDDLVLAFPNTNQIIVAVTKCAPPIPGMQGSAKVTSTYTR